VGLQPSEVQQLAQRTGTTLPDAAPGALAEPGGQLPRGLQYWFPPAAGGLGVPVQKQLAKAPLGAAVAVAAGLERPPGQALSDPSSAASGAGCSPAQQAAAAGAADAAAASIGGRQPPVVRRFRPLVKPRSKVVVLDEPPGVQLPAKRLAARGSSGQGASNASTPAGSSSSSAPGAAAAGARGAASGSGAPEQALQAADGQLGASGSDSDRDGDAASDASSQDWFYDEDGETVQYSKGSGTVTSDSGGAGEAAARRSGGMPRRRQAPLARPAGSRPGAGSSDPGSSGSSTGGGGGGKAAVAVAAAAQAAGQSQSSDEADSSDEGSHSGSHSSGGSSDVEEADMGPFFSRPPAGHYAQVGGQQLAGCLAGLQHCLAGCVCAMVRTRGNCALTTLRLPPCACSCRPLASCGLC